jgi:hypothetical protein
MGEPGVAGRNRAKDSDPYRGVSVKSGFDEIRWRYPESGRGDEVHVLDGQPFGGDITRAVPIRQGPKYRNRVNHEGLYVSAQTGQQVWYESMEEYVALMEVEHTMRVTSIAAQPCCFLFRAGFRHYPDFAVRTRKGGTAVLDVHEPDLTSLQDLIQFNRTARSCEQLGWGYYVLAPVTGYRRSNLVWLAGYRHSNAAPDPDTEARIMQAVRSPIGIMALARLLDPNLEWHYLPAIYQLMFTGALDYDNSAPFDDDTPVWEADPRR